MRLRLLPFNQEGFLCYKFPALFQFPPFKIPSFMFDLRAIAAKCVMLRCKYEEQICSALSICSPRQISLHYDNFQ